MRLRRHQAVGKTVVLKASPGKDTYAPAEFPYYWRVLETKDEYFDYYRDYHAFWNLYGMDLPDDVLRKVYYENALRVTPGLPQSGWPR